MKLEFDEFIGIICLLSSLKTSSFFFNVEGVFLSFGKFTSTKIKQVNFQKYYQTCQT